MQNDVMQNSFKHNERTNSSEVRNKTVYFMYERSILVALVNDGRPSFISVVEAEGSGCNWRRNLKLQLL